MKLKLFFSAAVLALAATTATAQDYQFTTVKENPYCYLLRYAIL